jgi:hypothetical protein
MVRLDEHVFVLPDELYQYILARPDEEDRDVTDQDTLRRITNGVCRAVESHLNRPVVIQADLTHLDDGGSDSIILPYRPVVVDDDHDIVVVENSSTLTQGTDYLLYASKGFIVRLEGEWYTYPQGTTVIYSAGWALQERGVPLLIANPDYDPDDPESEEYITNPDYPTIPNPDHDPDAVPPDGNPETIPDPDYDPDELTAITGCPEDIRLAALEWGRVTWRGGPALYTSQDDSEVNTSPAEMPGNVRGWLEPYRILRPGVA